MPGVTLRSVPILHVRIEASGADLPSPRFFDSRKKRSPQLNNGVCGGTPLSYPSCTHSKNALCHLEPNVVQGRRIRSHERVPEKETLCDLAIIKTGAFVRRLRSPNSRSVQLSLETQTSPAVRLAATSPSIALVMGNEFVYVSKYLKRVFSLSLEGGVIDRWATVRAISRSVAAHADEGTICCVPLPLFTLL